MGQVSEYEGVCCRGRQAAEGKDGTLKQNKAPGGRSRSPGHRPFLSAQTHPVSLEERLFLASNDLNEICPEIIHFLTPVPLKHEILSLLFLRVCTHSIHHGTIR